MKHFILIIILTSFFLTSFAQKEGFEGGVLGGMVFSQVDGDKFSGYNKFGGEFGPFVRTKISKKLGLHFEIKYMQKGSKIVNQKLGIYYKMSLHYVEMPVLLTYEFKKNISAEIGIAYAYLITAGEDIDGWGSQDPVPSFNKSDISFVFGLSYQLSERITANTKISYSIFPIRNHPGNQSYYFDRGQYNNLVSFSLYYKLGSE